MDFLREHSEGVVALSACLAGTVPQSIIKGDIAMAKKEIKAMKEIYGNDYYLEIQPNILKEQKLVNKKL